MIRFLQLRKTPFSALTAHFVRRLFASEEEQGNGSLGFGFGAILALVASPGAFASIVLLGKYSTLIAWMTGHRIDPIRRSPSDEYFFIVLSMTITGLVMVARWNRLFPDRRDFANLAVLPLLRWIAEHQPELLQAKPAADAAIAFEAEFMSKDVADLIFTMPLTEAVRVAPGQDGGTDLEHMPEPPQPEGLLAGAPHGSALAELMLGDQPVLSRG